MTERNQPHDRNPSEIPRLLPHFLSRDRLLATLDAAASDRLIVVRAPGGAGKTTLLVDWLRRLDDDRPLVWVSVDASARSRAGFWHRLAGALIAGGIGAPDGPLGDLLSGFIDQAEAAGVVLTELSVIPRPVRVILDDLHLVDDATVEDLAWLLERSDRLQLLVTTRRALALEDPRIAVRLEPTVITGVQLAFDLDETRAVVRRAHSTLTEADAAIIQNVTGGLPLATRVAISTFVRDATDQEGSGLDRSRIVERVASHAARDLLPAFSSEASRTTAMRIAQAPAVDLALAEALTDDPDVEQALREFERDGVGEFERRGRGLLFSFHALVRAALEWQAEEHLPADELAALRRTAAAHLAVTGDPLEALRLYARIGDFGLIWPVMARNFSDMINQHLTELKEIIHAIPDDAFGREGTLAAAAVVILGEGESVPSVRVRELVESALAQLEDRQEETDPVERFWNLLARFGALRAVRAYADAAIAGDEVVLSAGRLSIGDRNGVGSAIEVGLLQVVITYILVGRLEDAITLAHRLANDPHPVRGQHRLSLLAYIQALRGEMKEAAEFGGAIAQERVARWRTSIQAVGWYAAESMLHLEENQPRAARDMMSVLDSRLMVLEQWPYLLWVNGTTRLADGQADVGVDELAAAFRAHNARSASPFALDLLAALRSDLYLAAGEPDRAHASLEGRSPDAIPVRLSRARLRLAEGAADAAKLSVASLQWGDGTTPRQHAEALLLHAVADLRLGHPEEAAHTAHRAFTILEQRGLRLPIMMVPRADLSTIIRARLPERLAMLDGLADPFGRILSPVALTDREQLVLLQLVSDPTVEIIAKELFISPNTVKTHLKNLYRKLGVSSREAAITVGRQRGLLQH